MKEALTIRSYTGPRRDILRILDETPLNVLDVGCSTGVLGASIKENYPGATVTGLEFDKDFVITASRHLDKVIEVDLNRLSQGVPFGNFDLIIFADVLEHLSNPKEVFKEILVSNASDNCYVVISVPNVQHITVLANLIFGVWPERERGIFDKTHLRWFTLATIREFAHLGQCKIVKVSRRYRIFDPPNLKINYLARIFAFPPLRNFLAYQFVVLLKFSRKS